MPEQKVLEESQQDKSSFASLHLENQLCFPLYAGSRILTRLYQPHLEALGITYPQYVVLMVLWQDAPCSVSRIGDRAILNSNTLTPLLKRMEQLGLIVRVRDADDERRVLVNLTQAGWDLREQCASIPEVMLASADVSVEKLAQLKALLDELLPALQRKLK